MTPEERARIEEIRTARTHLIVADNPLVEQKLKEWDPLVDELHEHARKTAPLPMTGEALDWTDGRSADALRRAGLTYQTRAAAR